MMGTSLRAIEVTGSIDEHNELHLDEPLPPMHRGRVRVIILAPEETDDEEREWLQAAATNPAFDFLKASEEDIYSLLDGRPFRDEG